jgi:hypothetical protein
MMKRCESPNSSWEAPILELSESMTRYIHAAVRRDLVSRVNGRPRSPGREELLAFMAFLEDFLPDRPDDGVVSTEGIPPG